MRYFTSPAFWSCFQSLPHAIQRLADRSFELLKEDPSHPSLHLKHVGDYRTVRVGLHYRAIAVEVQDGLLWIWIGSHADYDRWFR